MTTLPHCEKLKLYPPAIALSSLYSASTSCSNARHVPMHAMFQCKSCSNTRHDPIHAMFQCTSCSNYPHLEKWRIYIQYDNIEYHVIHMTKHQFYTTLPRPKRCRGHYSPLHRRLFVLYFKLINFYNKFVGV